MASQALDGLGRPSYGSSQKKRNIDLDAIG
jgi:hypothetical protein